MRMRKIQLLLLSVFCFTITRAQQPDAALTEKIIDEGSRRSQVMDIAFHLTDVNGPRLSASPGFLKAAQWAKAKLASWGLVNAQLEPWGEFGKGWQQERSYIAMTRPYYQPLIAVPRAWTGSTPGNSVMTAEVVLIRAKDSAELMQYAGKLKGKIVMTWNTDTLRPSFEPDARRHADSVLERMAEARPAPPAPRQQPAPPYLRWTPALAYQRSLAKLVIDEQAALLLSMNVRGTDGTVFVGSGGSYLKDAPVPPASLVLGSDDYLRIQRLILAGIPVELETEVRTRFFTEDLKGYNVIAEIPGTDPKLKDEVVMLGGHLDSWHGATGATDNAAGCAVMMEAVRILKTLNVKPRRTIRIALWSGEEQGLHGSRNYVKNHFADPVTMQLKPAHEKVSAYFNLDNGGGKIRGIYAQGNEAVVPIFTQWLAPFRDMGAATVTINNTGSTDHVAFDAVGIPGFQFIQDPLEYSTRTHHSNMDTYDHLIPDDLKQAAVIVASFVYNTAQRDEKLPRKELPKPWGEGQRSF